MWVRGLSQRFIWYKHQALPGHLKQMKPCREENDLSGGKEMTSCWEGNDL